MEGREKLQPEEQMVEREIGRVGPDEHMASPVLVLQNPVKLLHLDHQLLLIFTLVICVIIQVVFGSEGMVVGFVSTVETLILLLVMVLDLLLVWLYSTRFTFSNLKTYLRTVAIVLQDYALLITLNRRYIEIAIIPFTIFAFIYALASKVSKCPSTKVTLRKGLTKSAKALKEMAMLPYLLQLSLVVWTQYKGQVEGNIFIFSNFLLYLGSVLCALTVMIASPPIGVNPGVIQVLPAMHKACIVMVMMTAHSMAAEWLGEDMVFACMPELTSVLAWFTIYYHHPEHVVSIKSTTSHGSLVIILSSVGAILACLASLYAEDIIGLRSWFVRVLCISCSSTALCYLDVWLLDQWPLGSTPNSNGGLVRLLKFSSVISSCVSACMLCADQQNLQEAFKYITIAEARFRTLVASQLMPNFLKGSFGSSLVILLGLLAKWLTGIEIKKRARLTREMSMGIGAGALSSPVDVVDKKLEKLQKRNPVSMDISSFRQTVKRMRSASVGPAGLKLVEDIQDWVDNLDQCVEVVTLHISNVINDWSEGSDDCNAATATNGSHINQDWFEFSNQYSEDYDAAAATAEHLYELQSRVHEVIEDRIMAPPAVKPQLTGLYEKVREAKYLEEILAETGWNRPKVVCIFGVAGSGKKKLALEVYQQIKWKFDYHLCVSVGQNPDMAKLVQNMIKQVDNDYKSTGGAAADVNQLTQSLRQLLQNKRYLVVLDNLWSNSDWRTMESCFPQDDYGSWIIITTRFEDAAKAAGDHFYWIHAPVEAEVESLFSRKISISLGGIFASKPHRKIDAFERSGLQWKELEQMKQFITVRYNGLSTDLRACLLYLSIFPEKHEVKIERLVRLWLADGFIQGHDGPFTEETARSYIDQLITRKLIEKSSHDHDGTIRSCTVHPLIHEFIVCQATENKYVSLVHAEQRDVSPSNPTVRWLSLQNRTLSPKWRQILWPLHQLIHIVNLLLSLYMQNNARPARNYGADLSRVRSVTSFGQVSGIPPLTKLSLLRGLDLEDCEGLVCLDGLCELKFLRYLNLRGTDVTELPAQIRKLIYLETLDVRSTKVKKLPPSVVNLENLMHLLAGNAELPTGIRKMKALVTVSCAGTMKSYATADIKELGEIASLRELELFCAVTQRSWDIFLPSIVKVKNQVSFMIGGFQSLKKLSIQCSFTSLIFEIGALPKVQVLELKFDKGVSEESAAVSGIEHLPRLEHVLLDFSQHGRGNAATFTAVKRAAEIHHKHPNVDVLGYKSD